ncbi:hemolysin III family protein [Rhodoblastus acidophilus]|uniref:Hemolysin III family protein n=1 Tax=Candidatus Rhodoblastus alkanivorans TaxID=2954117 RepID=A0ABS9Z8N9_9HYPH|nr:hemolysin III family protein [Candidatus Rhodoblastus alkanivorans]MCI4680548.1 hemolysin III family protein [Candidatus Rhodoblastus alkanivorans]MCI4683989.1 hemolysin III family protein [Candidatus Rhodoblastus alkanivorans]MDI4641308.1 hemolysin III family protein [Rhodoblastus acidophilus]
MSSPDDYPRLFKRAYSPAELIADAVVHGVAIIAGLIAFAVLFVRIALHGGTGDALAMSVYATGFFLLFGFSCAYNLTPPSHVKFMLRRFDHAAIFLMIAGTYTAILSQLPDGFQVWALATVIWAASLAGATFKILYPGKFDRAAVGLYLALGWAGVAAFRPLMAKLPPQSLLLLVIGGLLYSVGVVFHLWNSLKFQNAIWHSFVTAAAACQYAAIAVVVGR